MDKLNGRTDHRWIDNTEHIETIKKYILSFHRKYKPISKIKYKHIYNNNRVSRSY